MDFEGGIYLNKKGSIAFEVISEFLVGKINRKEAAELLEVRERTITRMARRIERKGLFGIIHGNRERSPAIKKPDYLKETVMTLVEEKYFDFNMTHCLEMLEKEQGIEVSYSTFRRWCHEKHLVKRKKRRKGIARYRRERMPNEGLLLQMDGSPHKWNNRDTWHLISAIDDATSRIPYAEFFHSEDTINCMKVLQKIIEKKGIPFAIYVDKAGCFGGGSKRARFNQFKRACKELGIKLIWASSPEAKGRIERSHDTHQDRIIPELRVHGIWTMKDANKYLQNTYLPEYWDRKNSVPPRNPESKYRPLPSGMKLKEILCLKDYRRVNGDHTVSWKGKTYQLSWPQKYSIKGRKIEIRTYLDNSLRVFFANKPLSMKLIKSPKRWKLAA